MPTVSIIVPIYNVEPYLRKCIDSILAQTYQNYELILVDDGSPDNCGAICDEYAQKDSRIHVIHKKNAGVSAARNTALEIASGKYITFCDSDDGYASDWIETLVTTMEQENADLVSGGFTKIQGEQKEVARMCFATESFTCGNVRERAEYCIRYILEYRHGWEVWTRLFKAEIIRNRKIRFCETCGNFAEDLVFTLEYAMHADHIVVIDKTGYRYTVRENSMMQSSAGKAKLNSVNEAALYFLDRLAQIPEMTQVKTLFPVFHFLIMNNQYQIIQNSDRYRFFSQYAKEIKQYTQWKYYSKKLLLCGRELEQLFGKQRKNSIFVCTFYHLSGNWKLFALGSELLERAGGSR